MSQRTCSFPLTALICLVQAVNVMGADLGSIDVSSRHPQEVSRGDVVEVSGLTQTDLSYVTVTGLEDVASACGKPLTHVPDARNSRIYVPVDTAFGRAFIVICQEKKTPAGPLLVVPIEVVAQAPQITAVDVPKESKRRIVLLGKDLAPLDSKSPIRLECRGAPRETAELAKDNSQRKLTVSVPKLGFFDRTCTVQLESALAGVLSNPAEIHFGGVQHETNKWLVGAVATLFLGIVLLAVWLLHGASPNSVLRTRMLMDEGAKRISLSRLQLYIWIAVLVPVIILLELLNGGFLATLPTGLLALVLISVLSASLGTHLNYIRWSDGPAQTEPARSDLFMEFGLILWERVVYAFCTGLTIVYLFAALASALADGTEYSFDIPVWLVSLNAIFTTLFLLGKVVRGSGPRIRHVEAVEGSDLRLTITGTNLSPDATFFLGAMEVLPQWMGLNPDSEHKPTVIQEDYANRGYARVMQLQLLNPAELGRRYTFAIRNPDGQRAQCGVFSRPPQSAPPTNGPIDAR